MVFMNMKICKKCGIEKPLDEIVKRNGTSDGYRPLCKLCYNQRKSEKRKNLTETEKQRIKEYNQNYRKINHDKIIINSRKYQEKNKEKEFIRKKIYREENPEKVKESIRKYKKINKDKIRKNAKEYYQNNKEKRRIYQNKKRSTDYNYRLITNLRSRINIFVKSKKIIKKNKTRELIGVTPDALKEHLEKSFTVGMSWENYGKWHIDHIIPLSSAKTEEELYRLCHYTNLQPLWAEDNLKKSNKLIKNQIL